MHQETERQTGDEIDRALARNGVRSGSPLEANVRARAYFIWGSAVAISATKPGDLGRKLDIYIADQRSNPMFADSFNSTEPKVRIPRGDLDKLRENFADIAAGRVLVE